VPDSKAETHVFFVNLDLDLIPYRLHRKIEYYRAETRGISKSLRRRQRIIGHSGYALNASAEEMEENYVACISLASFPRANGKILKNKEL